MITQTAFLDPPYRNKEKRGFFCQRLDVCTISFV